MFSDKCIQPVCNRQDPLDDLPAEISQVIFQWFITQPLFQDFDGRVAGQITFVKDLQGNAARLGSRLHGLLCYRFRIIDIFDMYVDFANFHANHFNNCPRHLVLNEPADIANVYVTV